MWAVLDADPAVHPEQISSGSSRCWGRGWGRISWCAYTILYQLPPSPFRAFLPTENARDGSSSRLKVRCFPKPKRRTCDRIGQERVSTLPESIRLIASDGSKVATRPHLVPERRGYPLNMCIAPRCETHMRFTPYTFSDVFIIMACVNSKQF